MEEGKERGDGRREKERQVVMEMGESEEKGGRTNEGRKGGREGMDGERKRGRW